MTDPGMTAFLEIRLALYQLLQRAYAAPLEAELADDLREAARVYCSLLDRPAPEVAAWAPDRDLWEYHRLFVGPGRLVAPPYESVYLSAEHVLMQDPTLEVQAFYRAHGRAGTPLLTEPEDHLAIELEFYAWLQSTNELAAQEQFLSQHLTQWVPEFCRRVREGSTSPFYRSLAAVTELVITSEAQVLNACAENGGVRS